MASATPLTVHRYVNAMIGTITVMSTPTVKAAARYPKREAVGPLIVIARYNSLDEVRSSMKAIPHSLTATVHSQPEEAADIIPLVEDLQELAGRVVFDGFPTGLRVSWAQHHGGPWPATNTAHTSVGVTAIRRFLRPLAWQDAPEWALPIELSENHAGVPRRVDGILTLATTD